MSSSALKAVATGKPEEGKDLAKWIEEEAYYGRLPRIMWTVHSDNVIATREIIMAMKSAERFWDQNERI